MRVTTFCCCKNTMAHCTNRQCKDASPSSLPPGPPSLKQDSRWSSGLSLRGGFADGVSGLPAQLSVVCLPALLSEDILLLFWSSQTWLFQTWLFAIFTRKRSFALFCALFAWKATKEYLNQRGTKSEFFECLFGPFSHPFPHHFFPLFPLQALFTLPPLFPSSRPPFPPLFLLPENSDLGTPLI